MRPPGEAYCGTKRKRDVSPSKASDFLCRQKVTKELSKGGGISISLPPLISPLLETTNLILADFISFASP